MPRSNPSRRFSWSTRCLARMPSIPLVPSTTPCRFTGVVLIQAGRMPGGGAALSVRHVTGKPLKFAGVGEKPGRAGGVPPERMASRILGMGDILSLVEDARRGVDEEKAKEFAHKLKSGKGRPQRLKDQPGQMKKMGAYQPDGQAAGPVRSGGGATQGGVEKRRSKRIEGIINSMTPIERAKPELLKASRKRRIAAGAGVTVQEVNRLLSQFEQTQKMMKQFSAGACRKMMRHEGAGCRAAVCADFFSRGGC